VISGIEPTNLFDERVKTSKDCKEAICVGMYPLNAFP
jgi:hypothetical protein